jgi:IPT/TIG domain
MQGTAGWLRTFVALWSLVGLLSLTGCNAINPLCNSARPAPTISSLSPAMIQFSDVQQGAVLTVNGNDFVSESVVVINGATVVTTVVSSQQLQVTLTTSLITGPGTENVAVNTPSGNSGDEGCKSGGTSGSLALTIT